MLIIYTLDISDKIVFAAHRKLFFFPQYLQIISDCQYCKNISDWLKQAKFSVKRKKDK